MDWTPNKENEPTKDGRYGVIYRQGATVRRFIADYDSVAEKWLSGMPDVQILAWCKLPGIPNWIIKEMEELG